MGIKNILWDEIEKEVKELSKMQVGTEQYKVTVDGIARLSDKIIELEKLESENTAKDFENFARTEEQELKREQLKSEKRDRAVKNVITVGTAVLSVAVYALAFIASTNFERDGSFTTEGGKNSIRQLLKLQFLRFKTEIMKT